MSAACSCRLRTTRRQWNAAGLGYFGLGMFGKSFLRLAYSSSALNNCEEFLLVFQDRFSEFKGNMCELKVLDL